MTEDELERARTWIGRNDIADDVVTPRLAAEFRATLAPALFEPEDGSVPLGLNWALAPEILPINALGPDGQARPGGFWPPTPLPRRMWASGEIEFIKPLKVGDAVRRTMTIDAVDLKHGRTGALFFVTVSVALDANGAPAIREQRSIVYRTAASAAPPPPEPAPPAELSWSVSTEPARLFRYSALTYNAHRIHLDASYATETEHYQGLVVHGPLQATLALNAAAALMQGAPATFSYRARSPLIAGNAAQIGARKTAANEGEAWTATAESSLALHGQARWR